jgi:hypothetical protein
VNTLGPVPAHPVDRLDWQRRAAAIGAWRELSGYYHPTDPIGSEPVAAAPDLRAAWHETLTALGPADGPDVRGMPEGMLAHLRDTYPRPPKPLRSLTKARPSHVRHAGNPGSSPTRRPASDPSAQTPRGRHTP